MDRHKKNLIDSAVKILDDEVALNMENLPSGADKEDTLMSTNFAKYKFVNSLVEPIDYVVNSLVFQPFAFEYTIKYLDTFIKEFDTLYSPSYRQTHWHSISNNPDPGELTFIFDTLYPSDKRVKEFDDIKYYHVILNVVRRFMVPFKIIQGSIAYRDVLYKNILEWTTTLSPCIFIKIYMTAVRDFFVSINNGIGTTLLNNKIEMLETKTGVLETKTSELERGLESVFRIASEHEGGGKKQKNTRRKKQTQIKNKQ